MTVEKCAKCGSGNLVPARLEPDLTFHVDDDTHHSHCRVPMKAFLCPACGYAEFWVIDPVRALPCDDDDRVLQEEDF